MLLSDTRKILDSFIELYKSKQIDKKTFYLLRESINTQKHIEAIPLDFILEWNYHNELFSERQVKVLLIKLIQDWRDTECQ